MSKKNKTLDKHENGNDFIADVISRFSSNQSLTLAGELRQLGVGLKILKHNKWESLSEYKLPFERFVPLYDDSFKICDIGVY